MGKTIGCSKETKERVEQKRQEFDDEESYYVGYDKALIELIEGYQTLEKIMGHYTEEQVLALAKGKAKVSLGQGQGEGEDTGESIQTQ